MFPCVCLWFHLPVYLLWFAIDWWCHNCGVFLLWVRVLLLCFIVVLLYCHVCGFLRVFVVPPCDTISVFCVTFPCGVLCCVSTLAVVCVCVFTTMLTYYNCGICLCWVLVVFRCGFYFPGVYYCGARIVVRCAVFPHMGFYCTPCCVPAYVFLLCALLLCVFQSL